MRISKLFMITLLLLCLIFSAHSEAAAPELPVFAWQRDSINHWQLTQEGAITDLAPHALDDALLCTVCGSEIWLFEDGAADVNDYDEYGNLTRYTSLDAQGAIVTETVHAYEYNEEGVVLRDLEFYNGVFCAESLFTVTEEGEQIPVSQTAYNNDGTTSVNTYDEHGNLVHSAVFTADGTVEFETITEYTLDDDGCYYALRETSRFTEGTTFYTEYNQYGDPILSRITEADGTTWSNHSYEYQYLDGMMVWRKQYDRGVLTLETWYNADGMSVKEIAYQEDGATEVWLFNENGDTLSVTWYRPDGSISQQETYEYGYAEDMQLLWSKVSLDGKLSRETQYAYDEEQCLLGFTETTWHKDGSRTVCTYNGSLELIQETHYDAEGNAN